MLLQLHFYALPQRCQLTLANFYFQRADIVDTTNRPTKWRRCDNIFSFAGWINNILEVVGNVPTDVPRQVDVDSILILR